MKTNRVLKLASITLLYFVYSCSNPENPESNNPPIAILSVMSNDSKITGTLTGSDSDGTISNRKVEIINSSNTVIETIITFSGDSFTSSDLANDIYTVRGIVVDNNSDSDTSTTLITINFTPPTLDITLTNGVTLFDENTEGTEVVFTINNVNNISGLTYSLNNTAQQFLEIDGNEVKRKIGVTFDYETLQDLNVIITATAGSESDSENASIMINDVTEVHDDTILNSPHNVKAFVTFDVADNDPANQNLIEYEVDVNGNSTGRTRAQMTADIAANSWPAGQGVNYIQALAAAEVVIKDGSGNSVLSSSSGADAELFRSAFIDTDGFNQTADQYHIDFHADGLEEIRKIFTAAGFTIPSATSWSIGTAVATPEEKRYTLANYMFADQLARERESGNMESINPDAVRKTANAILSLNDAQISDILDEYAANGYSTTVIGN